MFSVSNQRVSGFWLSEQKSSPLEGVDLLWHESAAYYLKRMTASSARYKQHADTVESYADFYRQMDRAELKGEVAVLRSCLRKDGFVFDHVASTFALIREYARRCLGMYHYRSQLIGGRVVLDGMIAEMETGEGKTFMATLPVITAALAGMSVHVITVNDYLAKRDCEWMEPLYRELGLSVGAIQQSMNPAERRAVYACDIVYCTNKEIVFDYLKDHLSEPVTRGPAGKAVERLCTGERGRKRIAKGLCYAIVDEADSILIDEAVTPLVISGGGSNQFEDTVFSTAIELAASLKKDSSFTVDSNEGQLELTPEGCRQLEKYGRGEGGIWTSRVQREFLVEQALRALHLFQRDKQYVVVRDRVQIIDIFTGRILEGRTWENGLQQMIECKEGCPLTGSNENLARITYQRFFRRYRLLAGMTGTAREVRKELWDVYSLCVVEIPSHKRNVRLELKTRLYSTKKEKFSAIIASVKKHHEQGRPVLIGTPVLAVSEKMAELLKRHGLSCRVLNALQDKNEAEVVALAGQKGQITVATNMAGRGTDIILGPGVKERGGLHVIATEMHSAARIDRQLFGRCGRQGDPGSSQLFISLEDDVFHFLKKAVTGSWLNILLRLWNPLSRPILIVLAKSMQFRLEKRGVLIRRQLLRQDEQLNRVLGLSGKGE
jgi:preprotein translocase subunit SecA